MAGLLTAKQYAERYIEKPNRATLLSKKSDPEREQPLFLWVLMHPERPVLGSAPTHKAQVSYEGELFDLIINDGIVRTYNEKLSKYLLSNGYQLISKEKTK